MAESVKLVATCNSTHEKLRENIKTEIYDRIEQGLRGAVWQLVVSLVVLHGQSHSTFPTLEACLMPHLEHTQIPNLQSSLISKWCTYTDNSQH